MAGNAVFLPPSMRSTYAPRRPSYARRPLSSIRSFVVFEPDFAAIENFIQDNIYSKVKVAQGMDLLVRTMAYVVKGNAQKRAAGPIAPRQRSVPALAYKIPVQRITGAYFAGWKVRRIGLAHWYVYNDSREAYLIETGMFMRVRRPILKLSLIDMLRMLDGTRTGARFLDWVIAPRGRATSGTKFARAPFYGVEPVSKRLQGASTLGGMAGPQGRLP